MDLPELKRPGQPSSGNPSANPWGGERVDGSDLELASFLTARVNRLARLLNKPTDRTYLVEFGVSMLEWRVLAHLSKMSPCLARDLVAAMGIDKASISRALGRLNAKKLVSVRASDHDARASIVTVLEAGEAMHQSLLPAARARQAHLLNALSAEQRRVLWEALGELTHAAEEITRKESRTPARPKR
jgi:DNA-binding MarR family transcriptional regulator